MSTFPYDVPRASRLSRERRIQATKVGSTPSSTMPPRQHSAQAWNLRHIVHLGQCPQCGRFLKEAITLPCGNTLCRACLPQSHPRKNISYPATANRLLGFVCPFSSCAREHAEGDCSGNVALNKIFEAVHGEMTKVLEDSDDHIAISSIDPIDDDDARNLKQANQGASTERADPERLASLYHMVQVGDSRYKDTAESTSQLPTEISDQDVAILTTIRDLARSELDCQVCYGLFLEPLTLACGHTFCRRCIHRILDHSTLCPACRRHMSVPPPLLWSTSSDVLLTQMIRAFCPEALIARAAAVRDEEKELMGDLDTPLFICTLSFPAMPTFLHIFEPRYRLMMRRAVESGGGKFGMLRHNPAMRSQGQLGRVPFYQYGTLLHILSVELLPDGRSLIESVGVSRFRVVNYGQLDGYTIGKIERIDDISLAAEEALEAAETASDGVMPVLNENLGTASLSRSPSIASQLLTPPASQESMSPALSPSLRTEDAATSTPTPAPPSTASAHSAAPANPTAPDTPNPLTTPLDRLPTQSLLHICTAFVTRMEAQSAPWLHSRIFAAYGPCPEDDPKTFPWWFASVLPTSESERYRLLATDSVRDRLKICAGWVAMLESRGRW